MKYPISCKAGKVSDFFKEIFLFHSNNKKEVWDCTCGRKYIWESFQKQDLKNFNITFSDIRKIKSFYDIFDKQTKVLDYNDININKKIDLIIFDPPFLFGIKAKKDLREEDYGNYNNSYEELLEHMHKSKDIFNKVLSIDGKIILKCSDMYYKKENKFYFLHYTWTKIWSEYFKIIDFFVYAGHRFSPTAFQVKNRSCCVNQHSYFMIFMRNNDNNRT